MRLRCSRGATAALGPFCSSKNWPHLKSGGLRGGLRHINRALFQPSFLSIPAKHNLSELDLRKNVWSSDDNFHFELHSIIAKVSVSCLAQFVIPSKSTLRNRPQGPFHFVGFHAFFGAHLEQGCRSLSCAPGLKNKVVDRFLRLPLRPQALGVSTQSCALDCFIWSLAFSNRMCCWPRRVMRLAASCCTDPFFVEIFTSAIVLVRAVFCIEDFISACVERSGAQLCLSVPAQRRARVGLPHRSGQC